MHHEDSRRRMLIRTVMAACVPVILSCGQEAAETPVVEHTQSSQVVHWDYGPENGPEQWGILDPDWILCAEGQMQSPIDISNVTEAPTMALRLTFPRTELSIVRQEHVFDAINNGHTIQVNYDAGDTLYIGDDAYVTVQLHFHAPSEHTLNGQHFPMEMHIVHRNEVGKLAVVGAWIEEGQQNAAFDILWANLPETAGGIVQLDSLDVDIDDMITEEWSVYRYLGSLTTPPCSEGVRWFVRVKPLQMSAKQIKAYKDLYYGNNRPVQPLNDRDLVIDPDV